MGLLQLIFGKKLSTDGNIEGKTEQNVVNSGDDWTKYTNLTPGEQVPKTGRYKCNVCMEGGMVDLLLKTMFKKSYGNNFPTGVKELRKLALDSGLLEGNLVSIKKQLIGNEVEKEFKVGTTFPQCPNCGPSTGWTSIEYTIELIKKYENS